MIKLMIVLSRKIMNSFGRFRGILVERIMEPFSDMKISCVIEMTATKNLVYGEPIVPDAKIAGINISANPATMV